MRKKHSEIEVKLQTYFAIRVTVATAHARSHVAAKARVVLQSKQTSVK